MRVSRTQYEILYVRICFESAGVGSDWGEAASDELKDEVRANLSRMSDDELAAEVKLYTDSIVGEVEYDDLVEVLACTS